MKLRLKMFTAAAVTAVSFAAPAFADAGDNPTLKRIQERGTVSIGHRET